MAVKSDIEIAREAKKKPIQEIGAKLGMDVRISAPARFCPAEDVVARPTAGIGGPPAVGVDPSPGPAEEPRRPRVLQEPRQVGRCGR